MMGDEVGVFPRLLSPSSTFAILMLGQYHMQSQVLQSHDETVRIAELEYYDIHMSSRSIRRQRRMSAEAGM